MYTNLPDILTRLAKMVALVSVIISVALAAVTWLVSPTALAGTGVAAAVGLVLAAITWFTTEVVKRHPDFFGAAMMGDYLIKLLVVLATVLLVRSSQVLEPRAVAYALVILVLAQGLTQAWILMRAKIQTIELAKKDNR